LGDAVGSPTGNVVPLWARAHTGVRRVVVSWVSRRRRSSQAGERGFCAACGTPLSFRYLDRDRISISLGSLDDPRAIAPARQYGIEGRLPFLAELSGLPGSRTEDEVPAEARERLKSRQHPDHS